jgi:phosphate acyltransferase
MRLAVDVMGGDHGPEELLQGIQLGLSAEPGISRLLAFGPEKDLRPIAIRIGLTDPRFEIRHAAEVLTMEDDPAVAVRRKKDSSMMRAITAVGEGEADAMISSGNTGALYAGGSFRVGRSEGVKRATIACILPNKSGAWVLVDGGANPECEPEHLLQFAIMGSAYARMLLGVDRPRIGVLSNGSEEAKGTEITRQAVGLIRQTDLNFRGYCEGYDLFLGGVDVCVCDGFVGNIVLKTSESLGKCVGQMLREELTATPLRKAGALLAKGGLDQIKRRMNPEEYGGAPLLGLDGCVIKIHGGARRTALAHAMRQARKIVDLRVHDTIVRDLGRWTQAATPGAVKA